MTQIFLINMGADLRFLRLIFCDNSLKSRTLTTISDSARLLHQDHAQGDSGKALQRKPRMRPNSSDVEIAEGWTKVYSL